MAIEDYNATGLTIQQAIQVLLVNDLTELFSAQGLTQTELTNARVGEATLLAKEQDQDTKIQANTVQAQTGFPDQTGKDGNYLVTDGAVVAWSLDSTDTKLKQSFLL